MWGVQQVLRILFAAGRRGCRVDRPASRHAGPATDWLPPVLGPQDWQTGLMADRSAGWYFDRN